MTAQMTMKYPVKSTVEMYLILSQIKLWCWCNLMKTLSQLLWIVFLSNSGENASNLKVEEKMIAVANILGISMEGQLKALRSFLHKMLKEESNQAKVGNQSKKKSRAQ